MKLHQFLLSAPATVFWPVGMEGQPYLEQEHFEPSGLPAARQLRRCAERYLQSRKRQNPPFGAAYS